MLRCRNGDVCYQNTISRKVTAEHPRKGGRERGLSGEFRSPGSRSGPDRSGSGVRTPTAMESQERCECTCHLQPHGSGRAGSGRDGSGRDGSGWAGSGRDGSGRAVQNKIDLLLASILCHVYKNRETPAEQFSQTKSSP